MKLFYEDIKDVQETGDLLDEEHICGWGAMLLGGIDLNNLPTYHDVAAFMPAYQCVWTIHRIRNEEARKYVAEEFTKELGVPENLNKDAGESFEMSVYLHHFNKCEDNASKLAYENKIKLLLADICQAADDKFLS